MIIEFSEHALDAIKKRKIPKNEIIATVNHPEEIIKSYRGREMRRKKFHGKILEVVTVIEDGIMNIITLYYLGVENES